VPAPRIQFALPRRVRPQGVRAVEHPSRMGPREREALGLDGSILVPPALDAVLVPTAPVQRQPSEAPAVFTAVQRARVEVAPAAPAAEEPVVVADPPATPVTGPAAVVPAPTRPPRASRRRRPVARMKVALTVLALGLATAGVFAGSHASWTASSSNPSNSVMAGTLTMSNDKSAAAVFMAATNAKPGDTGSGVVRVRNTGSIPMTVGLLQDSLTSTGIESSLNISVHDDARDWCYWPTTGSGPCSTYGAFNASGTLAPVTILNSSNGAQWAANEYHDFTVSWTLLTSSPNSDQGKTGSFRLVWSGAQ
jgi:hypothetical protein